jgi:hypothetical protein
MGSSETGYSFLEYSQGSKDWIRVMNLYKSLQGKRTDNIIQISRVIAIYNERLTTR